VISTAKITIITLIEDCIVAEPVIMVPGRKGVPHTASEFLDLNGIPSPDSLATDNDDIYKPFVPATVTTRFSSREPSISNSKILTVQTASSSKSLAVLYDDHRPSS